MLRKSTWQTYISNCKSIDTSVEATVSNDVNPLNWYQNPSTGCLNGVSQGTGDNERIGNTIRVTKVTVHGVLSRPNALYAAAQPRNVNIYRIWLVLDRQTHEGSATSYPLQNVGGTTLNNVGALVYKDFEPRYTILDDAAFRLAPKSIAWNVDLSSYYQVGNEEYWEIEKNVNFLTTFSGSGDTISDILSGSLHIMACCNEEPVLTTIAYQARVEYYDDQ